jgi:hypothetical protein
MLQLLQDCVSTLNRLEVGEFSLRQLAWRASICFGGTEVAWADTTQRRYNCFPLKIPVPIPHPPDIISRNIILTSLLSCAVAMKVFGEQWQEAHFIGVLNEIREWAIIPPNAATHPLVISLPPLVTWSGDEPYEVKLIVYPFPNEEPKILKLKPSELPSIREIMHIIALMRL